MPGGDRTGPWGAGPMTGRAAGYCTGYPVSGYANPPRGYVRGFGRGRGRGFGRGWGRGFGRRWYAYTQPTVAPPTIVQPTNPQDYPQVTQPQLPQQEVTVLEGYHKDLVAEKVALEQELEGVKARIEELKAKIGSK